MKNKIHMMRLAALSLVAVALGSSVSCMTTYDSAGRPVQSVDPGLAVAGVAAAGLIGYAAGNDNDHHHHGGYYRGGYGGYRGGYYRGGREYRRY